MACRNKPPVSLALLLVGALHCGNEPSRMVIGRLDLVVRGDNTVSSSRPLTGAFMLRDLERGTHERLEVYGHDHRMRSVWLAPGAYVLEWQPALELAEVPGSDARAPEPHVVVIADGRVSTVNVRTTQTAGAMRDAISGVVD